MGPLLAGFFGIVLRLQQTGAGTISTQPLMVKQVTEREQTMAFAHATQWQEEGGADEHAAGMQRDFWRKAVRVAARLPFAEDLLAAYYCAFDRATPMHVKAALFGALAYFVLPFDFMPDILPFLGFTDDAAVLLTAVRMVAGHLRPEHRDAARAALERMKAGAA
jgi:uncharacterized membrane protein YkvA (DUF1232 family)